MTPGDIKEIMGTRGKYGVFTQKYGRFKADRDREYKAKETVEYLHYVICC
jgi:adenine-specific DNA methylase